MDASDVVGLSMYAKTTVDIKSGAYDDSPVIRTAVVDSWIGTVYSWLEPREGRSRIHWMFYDNEGNAYYVEHKTGSLRVSEVPADAPVNWWENLFSGTPTLPGSGLGSNVSKMIITGGLLYLAFRYGPSWVKALKK